MNIEIVIISGCRPAAPESHDVRGLVFPHGPAPDPRHRHAVRPRQTPARGWQAGRREKYCESEKILEDK